MSLDKGKLQIYRNKWEFIYQQYYQLLCFFAYGYLKDKALSEDIVQGVFVKFLEDNIIQMEGSHLRNYLYKSVKNSCLNELSSNALHDRILGTIGVENKDLYEDDALFYNIVQGELYRQILEAVNQLPEKTGEVFKLAYFEQKSNPEIADELVISVNTVKVHKNNAKKQLRLLLKDVYPLALPFLIAILEKSN